MRWILASLTLLLSPAAALGQERPATLAIVDVALVDSRSDAPRPGFTVLVEGGQITAVEESAGFAVPEGAEVLDGTGRFLIPGLWDMHVHATSPGFAQLYIANGVTGVRDMFSPMATIRMVRDQVDEGDTAGPRIVAAGRIVDGEDPVWDGSVEAIGEDAGRDAVATVQGEGSDFVKVYARLGRDTYFAIAEAATEAGLPFAGHVPASITPTEAAEAGQRSIEHLDRILAACSSESEELRKMNTRSGEGLERALSTYDQEVAFELFATFIDNDTWHCPTLTVLRSIAHLDDEEFTADPRVRYLPPFWKGFWNPAGDFRFQSYTEETWADNKRSYARHLQLLGDMHRAGVRLLAGTDVANPYCFPGFSLHDELELMVECGLDPADALRTATLEPAQFLEREDELGTIEVGKLADLVLLDADPLEEIGNTRRIRAVVADGRLYLREALDEILERASGGR